MQSTLVVQVTSVCCFLGVTGLALLNNRAERVGQYPHPPVWSPAETSHRLATDDDRVEASQQMSYPDDADRQCLRRLRRLGVVATTGPCYEVDKVVDELTKGDYLFNKPAFANVGDTFPLRLILKTSEGQTVSFAGLPGFVEKVEQKPFAQSLEATLSGGDFLISPSAPQPRTATLSQPVEWEWNVKPTAAGNKTLTVEVAGNIIIGPEKHRVQIITLHKPIEIHVTMFQRVKSYATEANTFVVALAGLAGALTTLFMFAPKFRGFLKEELKLFRGVGVGPGSESS